MEKTSLDALDIFFIIDIGILIFCVVVIICKVIAAVIREREKEEERQLKEYEKEQAEQEKERERWERLQEKNRQTREKQKAIDAKKKEAEKKRLQQEKERNERIAALPEHRRFIAEQRRLMTDSLRYDVMQRDGFRCQICGATAKDGVHLHVDHILPVSKGGKTELSNLRTLCERCNLGKRDKIETLSNDETIQTYTPEEFAEKFVRNTQHSVSEDERKEPIRRFQAGTSADVLNYLNNKGVEYIDKSSLGGGLYFFDEQIAEQLKRRGYIVCYARNGTKSTAGKPAWYIHFNKVNGQ